MTLFHSQFAPRPQLKAFLEDIREHPLDDTPRLILADWLTDHGNLIDQARAEFIRGQCQLASKTSIPCALLRQLRTLLASYAGDWLGELAHRVDCWRFERGLLCLTLSGRDLFEPELLRQFHGEPYAWVSELTIRHMTGSVINVLEQQPVLRLVHSLTLEDSRPGALALARLTHLPCMVGLHELNLAFCSVEASCLEELLDSPYLSRLGALHLTRNYCGDAGLDHLIHAGTVPALTRLGYGYNHLSPTALARLNGTALLARLTYLDLRGNPLCGQEGLARLFSSGQAACLRSFLLDHVHLSLPAIRGLEQSHLPQLVHLSLNRTNLPDEAVKRLALSTGIPRLSELFLGRNQLTDNSVIALSQANHFRLRRLDLSHNHLGPSAAVALATNPAFANLEELNLEDNHIGSAGALVLAASPYLGRLRALDVGHNGLDARSCQALRDRFGSESVLT